MRPWPHLRRWYLPLVALLAVAFTTPAAADAPQAGVAFVSEQPFALGDAVGETLAVELFNGHAEPSTLRLAVTGDAKPYVSITPEEDQLPAGGIAEYTVTLVKVTDTQVTGQLIAYSTDGTMKRAALTVGKPRPEAAAEAAAGYPKSLNFGVVDTSSSPKLTVANLPGEATEAVQVGHVSADGEVVPVTRKGDELTVSKLGQPAEYSGTVDLAPGEDGGDVELAAAARQEWWWAVVLLAAGLILAIALEVYLRRRRPEQVLQRRLRELQRVVALRQDNAKNAVRSLRPQHSGPKVTWGVPRIYDQADHTSLFRARAEQITQALTNSPSDAERDRWGPDGEEMKEFDTDIETYGEILDTLIALAQDWAAFVKVARRDRGEVDESPLRELVDRQLSDRAIASGRLDAESQAVNALTAPVTEVAALYPRFERLEQDAREVRKDDAAAKAAEGRVALVRSVEDAEDAKAFAEKARALAKSVYGRSEAAEGEVVTPLTTFPGATPAGAVAAAATRVSPRRRQRSPSPRAHMTPPDDAPASPLTKLPREEGIGGWFRRNFSIGDLIFGLVSLAIVLLSGMSLLYYGDDTWGSRGDEIAALVWGSTATAAISLARRLLPGATKHIPG